MFLKKNSAVICRDSLYNQPDWSSLLPHVKDKKIILIGELNHGSKEIFETRNSFIKYLHEQTGANVILFESGIGELITSDRGRDTLKAAQMTYGFFGGWRTKEFVALMDYVKSKGISIAGFDVQRTGGSFQNFLTTILGKYGIDTTGTSSLELRYGSVGKELTGKKAVYDSLKVKTNKLIDDYQKTLEKVSAHTTSGKSKDLLFTIITLQNRVDYLTYMLRFLNDRDWSKRWAARDTAMARNVQWLIDNIYVNQKVIIVGHNFHIGKYSENETTMGEILKTRHNREMYSLGVFARSGTYSDNFGREITMVPPDSIGLDIKQVIAELPGAVNFIDMPEKLAKDCAWLNEDIPVNDTFIDIKSTNKMNVYKTFDGLLLLQYSTPAK